MFTVCVRPSLWFLVTIPEKWKHFRLVLWIQVMKFDLNCGQHLPHCRHQNAACRVWWIIQTQVVSVKSRMWWELVTNIFWEYCLWHMGIQHLSKQWQLLRAAWRHRGHWLFPVGDTCASGQRTRALHLALSVCLMSLTICAPLSVTLHHSCYLGVTCSLFCIPRSVTDGVFPLNLSSCLWHILVISLQTEIIWKENKIVFTDLSILMKWDHWPIEYFWLIHFST